MDNSNKRSTFNIVKNLLSLVGNLVYVVILAVLNGSIGHIFAIFIPILGAVGVAKILGATLSISYTAIIVLIIIFGVLRGAMKYFEQYSNHYIAFKLLAVLRDKIFARLRVLCPAKLENKKKGTIISLITADIETIEVFYAHTISPVCIAISVSLAVFLFVGFVVNWYLALYILFAYIVVGIILPMIGNKYTAKYGENYRKEFTLFNGYFMDAIKGNKDIILHGKQQEKTEKINDYTQNLLVATKDMKYKGLNFQAFLLVILTVLNLGMLLIGVFLENSGIVEIPLILIAVVSLMSSYGPLLAITSLSTTLSQTFTSAGRLLDLFEEKPAVNDIENGKDFNFDSLEIENLSFSYDKNADVLKDINMNLKNGDIVGIMGKSGCGKSTLLKLMLRFWAKDSGELLYNNIDIEKINSKSLKSNVTMVSQTTYLFDDTISNNLKIAKENATQEEIENACKMANIHEHISTLKDGYETKIGASGLAFSAGETQRIGLARAFLSDSKLILLDEPTSNVDAINEGMILKSLLDQKNKKTIILVSHRESTLSIANKLYKMENGLIEEVVR